MDIALRRHVQPLETGSGRAGESARSTRHWRHLSLGECDASGSHATPDRPTMTRTGIAVSSPDGFPTLSVGRWVKVMVILCAVAVVGLLVCLQFGTERIPLSQIARIVMNWSHEQMGAET